MTRINAEYAARAIRCRAAEKGRDMPDLNVTTARERKALMTLMDEGEWSHVALSDGRSQRVDCRDPREMAIKFGL